MHTSPYHTGLGVGLILKGRVISPLLALAWPCFRQNVIVISKIVSFLCSLDTFLLKKVIESENVFTTRESELFTLLH